MLSGARMYKIMESASEGFDAEPEEYTVRDGVVCIDVKPKTSVVLANVIK